MSRKRGEEESKKSNARGRKPSLSRMREIREVLDLLKDTDIEEIELAVDDLKIRIRKRGAAAAWVPHASAPPASGVLRESASALFPPAVQEQGKEVTSNLVTITSPMVGTFYRAPFPGAEPFVNEGDIVEKGKTLCIIEAMKLMNEIEAELSGRIGSVLVENAQPVEYGQPLFLIEPL